MSDKREANSALQKGLTVLDTVAAETRPIGLPELTERLGWPKQTVHRLLRQLEEEGYVQREPLRDRYIVGPRANRIALNTLSSSFQRLATHSVLETLVEGIGETCNVGMLDGAMVYYLDRVECDWPLRLQLQPASRLPAHCTSLGKLLIAFLPDRRRKRLLTTLPLERYTDHTLTDAATLETEMNEIRVQEYAINNQEYFVGLVGLAVPVRDASGRVIAGLAVHGPQARFDVERALQTLPRLRVAAEDISHAFQVDLD